MSVLGRIHSFESCGTVDGPGIRFYFIYARLLDALQILPQS